MVTYSPVNHFHSRSHSPDIRAWQRHGWGSLSNTVYEFAYTSLLSYSLLSNWSPETWLSLFWFVLPKYTWKPLIFIRASIIVFLFPANPRAEGSSGISVIHVQSRNWTEHIIFELKLVSPTAPASLGVACTWMLVISSKCCRSICSLLARNHV